MANVLNVSRYTATPKLNFGTQYGTSDTVSRIRTAISAGVIQTQVIFLKDIIRLDVLAGQYYGEAKYYWLIAAASNIGWGLQIPPNTRIVIPNLEQSLAYLS